MDTIESELLSKLENVFGFNFKKNYQDLTKPELFDVYKLLLKCYNESWVLNAEQSDQKNLKTIQGYLKILDLGHLIARDTKFDELVDPKRNARLLGGLISKLQSRHSGAKLQGIIRKIKLAKVKPQTGKRNQLQKNNSSESSAGEEEPKKEPLIEDFVVPIKGKEIPRTPPVSGKTGLKSEEFLKPPPAISPRSQTHRAAANKKNFQPILPTKEIPRTPLKGGQSQPSADVSVYGRNPDLTVDFSASRLTSSNTSTPYEERTTKITESGDATFVLPPKLSQSLETPTEELISPPLPDKRAIRRGTFVLTQGKVQQQDADKMSEEIMKLDAEDNDEQQQADAPTSPEAPETKKKGGRQQRNKNAKNTTEQEKQTEPDSTPANSEAASKGKKGRGKKAAADPSAETASTSEVVAADIEVKTTVKPGRKNKNEVQPEHDAPTTKGSTPELKEKKGGGKALAKAPVKESTQELEKSTGEAKPSEENESAEVTKPGEEEKQAEEVKSVEEVKSAPAKKGRARKGKPQEQEVEDQGEVKENEESTKSAVEASPKPQIKRGRGKQAKEAEKTEDAQPESKVLPSPRAETRKGRGKLAKEPEKTEDAPVESAVETSPKIEAKKGRGKQTKQTVSENKKEDAMVSSAVEPSPIPEVRKGRGKQVKEPMAEAAEDESTETNENAVSDAPDSKAKKGRGKKADEAPATNTDDKKVSTPEVKGTKGGRKAANKLETEPTRKSARTKPDATKSYEELDNSLNEAKGPEAPKKGRAKKTKANDKAEDQSENIEDAPSEDAEKEMETEAPKTEGPKGKRNYKRNDTKPVQEVTEDNTEQKQEVAKSPERPLRPVNEAEDETLSPSKRKTDEEAANDAPPEKKKRGGRAAKKDPVQSAQVENQPPAEEAPAKRGAKKAKETASETEKKKPAARKKPADTHDDEIDETLSPSKPKRAAKSTAQVNRDAKVAEAELANPSPVAPEQAKGRGSKLAEKAAKEAVTAPAKRGGRARKAK